MEIKTILEQYKIQADYFAPDYNRNNPVLTAFKKNYLHLSEQQTSELIHILKYSESIEDKYFVADLLYLYNTFAEELSEALMHTAIHHKDPSFNRIFIRPCIKAFGIKLISENLTERFNHSTIEERIGISNLVYWLRPNTHGEVDKLHRTIIDKANTTKHLIELYHYKLHYPDKIKSSIIIPENAVDLIKAISGNSAYEDLLFNTLGWNRI